MLAGTQNKISAPLKVQILRRAIKAVLFGEVKGADLSREQSEVLAKVLEATK